MVKNLLTLIKNLKKINYIIDKKRPTTIKERFMVDGYKLLQLDVLKNEEVSKEIIKKITYKVKKLINLIVFYFLIVDTACYQKKLLKRFL